MAITKHTRCNWLIVICIQSVLAVSIIAEDKNFQYDCFSDSKIGTCQESRVKISGQYYGCDMVMKLSSPPKRIGLKNGAIMFSSEGKSYEIVDDGIQEVHKVILPVGEIYDERGNIYYSSDGTSYVFESVTGKELEIITTGKFSSNQHAFDDEANKLFILSFTSHENADEKSGELYTITTDRLSIVNDKVFAELISSVGSRITAIAVQPEAGILVLGLKEDVGGKLIRLRRQKSDPCSRKDSYKVTIVNLIKDVKNKIANIVSMTPKITGRSIVDDDIEKQNLFLIKDNERIKREINETSIRLNKVTDTLKGFPKTLHSPKTELPAGEPSSPQEAPAPPFDSLPPPITPGPLSPQSITRPPAPPARNPYYQSVTTTFRPPPPPPPPSPRATQPPPPTYFPSTLYPAVTTTRRPTRPPLSLQTTLRPFMKTLPTRLTPPPPNPFVTTSLRPTTYLLDYPDQPTPRSPYPGKVTLRSSRVPANDEDNYDDELIDGSSNCVHLERKVNELMDREAENKRKFDDLLTQLDKITNIDI